MNIEPSSKTFWPLVPRKVSFNWKDTPLHWIPQSPFASHAINHFSFTLVRGEYFFCRIFNKALPYVNDEKLKQDVTMFIRQEAIHAQAHKESIEQYLQKYGVDAEKQYATVVRLFDHALADNPFGIKLPKRLQKTWLTMRLGVVASAEHYTSALGMYVLEKAHWEKKGADPVMSDLFTWHGAEEVEHRAVAYDLFQYLNKDNYAMRSFVMLSTAPIMTLLMIKGTQKLAATDPDFPKEQKSLIRSGFWKAWASASKQELLPPLSWFITIPFSFFKRDYHPIYEASTQMALDYINNSPAVKAFEQQLVLQNDQRH